MRMMMTAVLAACVATPATAATVPNAGFEAPLTGSWQYNPTVAGMTFNTRSGVAANTFFQGTPPEGRQAGFIQNSYEAAGQIDLALSDLTAGATYTASFYLAQRGSPYAANPLEVFFNGASLGVYSPPSTAFTQFTTGGFTTSGTTGTLSFVGTGPRDDSDTAIDLVQLTQTADVNPGAVPEAATWTMMILGVGAIGYAMRRSRKAPTRVSCAA